LIEKAKGVLVGSLGNILEEFFCLTEEDGALVGRGRDRQKVMNGGTKSVSEAGYEIDSGCGTRTFQSGQVCLREARLFRQVFLGESARSPQFAEPLREGLNNVIVPNRSLLAVFHGDAPFTRKRGSIALS
jgi:hypothetical protein